MLFVVSDGDTPWPGWQIVGPLNQSVVAWGTMKLMRVTCQGVVMVPMAVTVTVTVIVTVTVTMTTTLLP